MKHKSFEDEEVKILNDDYISIKVDREERPNKNHSCTQPFNGTEKSKEYLIK
ncbi:DUF255 domain-containing protein [Romboutsia sp.]|uniref:DUF255 domain-containing protein n=1 Tax=Romboutsia sp. TaxID=1965302 RepID=UPI002F429F98